MLPDHHGLVTAIWITLYLLPLILVALIWSFFGVVWGLVVLALYVIGIIPYGFFVSLPTMVKLFRKPASIHRR